MGGLARAFGRLLVMGAVMTAVLATCLVAGVGTTIAVALAIVLAGLVGLIGVARRPRDLANLAVPGSLAVSSSSGPANSPASIGAAVEAKNPTTPAAIDPESLMPRWRRPSLIQARLADPTRAGTVTRAPLRFGEQRPEADLRVVRYAVVPVMDRPDEVLGSRLTDLGSGDEVEVVGAAGTFLEVICPGGERGWIHRTTISAPRPAYLAPEPPAEAEDALTALLAARGLQ